MSDGAVRTIQQMIDHGIGMSMWCNDCKRGGWVDLRKVADHVGGDFDCYTGKRFPIRCAKCDSRNTAVSLHGARAWNPKVLER